MQRGTILEAVRQQNRSLILGVSLLCAILLAVLGYNWKYLYNWAAGPFEFDAALAADPGAREFVRAEGPMLPTGLSEESTLRLFRGAVESTRTSANYLAMLAGDGLLMVKVEPEFSGSVVEGELGPLPEAIRVELTRDSESGETPKVFHPYLLEQSSYRWDANLFVMVATPLFPLALLLLVVVIRQAGRPEEHAALKRLSRLGPYRAVVSRIEKELAAAGPTAAAGPLWVTGSWVAALQPSVLIYPIEDLVGFGLEAKATKSGPTYELRFWAKGSTFSDSLTVSKEEARIALGALAKHAPWALVEDVEGFGKRWRRDAEACARDTDARRREAQAAAK